MASLSEEDRAALRESWRRQSAAVHDYLWVLAGRKNAPSLREPLHAAFLKLAALPKPPEDERAALFRFAREAAGHASGQAGDAELLNLKFGHGLSYEQIGAIVKLPLKQIGARFHQALRQSHASQGAPVAQFLP